MLKNDAYFTTAHKDREAAKRVLCAIIQKSNGVFRGQTRLYKAFYWAHLEYWRSFSGVLTAYPIARMPNGPGIDDGEELLFEMQRQGLILVTRDMPDAKERVFKLTASFEVNLTDDEEAAVNYGVGRVEGKSAKEVSEETHENSRSWRRLSNGKIMDIYEDLLSEEDVAENRQIGSEVQAEMDAIFGG